LKKSKSNKKIFSAAVAPVLFAFSLIIYSCNPTKYVPEDQSLLDNNYISLSKDHIGKSELLPYLKQKPNKRIFGARFHLGLYNLSNIKKEKWPNGWLRSIGEEPVIYDPQSTEISRQNLQSYIASKGYLDSKVTDSVRTEKKKSEVYYNVTLKKPYTIRNLYFGIEDTTIRKYFFFDSVNCMIERGKSYDEDKLQSERTRIERFIRDRGFYNFSGDYVSFRIDSTIGNRQVNIYYDIRKNVRIDRNGRLTNPPFSIYALRNIYVYTNYVPREILEGGEAYVKSFDTVKYKGYFFITRSKRPTVNYDVIIQSLYLKPGSVYSYTNTEQSQQHIMNLKEYRLVNIFFSEPDSVWNTPDLSSRLDCHIQLTQLSQQSFNVELEGTNTAGNLGGALNLIYTHRDLFHGAEQFSIKLKGAFEAMTQFSSKLTSTREYGFETSLRLPKFLLPFLKKEEFIKKYSPTTTILAAYDYQNMPLYTRTIANATFGYTWAARNYRTHIVNPVQLNLVKLLSIDSTFQKTILASSYLAYSYRNVMILGGNYSFIFNNQKLQKVTRDYWFIRVNAEASGNVLSLVSGLSRVPKKSGSYNIFGQPFAQYIRSDIDLRYNVILNDISSIVYRGFFGIGVPYGNSVAIPFEKQYFGGGANDIRAWQVRSLGPGSYKSDATGFINQTADIKLEGNAEYRFKLFWILEGALFLDAGNIWAIREDQSRPGAKFELNKFYNDIAVGTGTGLRFDFKFVTGRVDLGIKLRDPAIMDASKWIFVSQRYNFRDDFTVVFGIGYPF